METTSFSSKEYGKRVRALRKDMNKTQEQMANDLQITDIHLRRIETGKSVGSVDLVIELSAYLGVTIDYLLLGKTAGNEQIKTELLEISERIKRLSDRFNP